MWYLGLVQIQPLSDWLHFDLCELSRDSSALYLNTLANCPHRAYATLVGFYGAVLQVQRVLSAPIIISDCNLITDHNLITRSLKLPPIRDPYIYKSILLKLARSRNVTQCDHSYAMWYILSGTRLHDQAVMCLSAWPSSHVAKNKFVMTKQSSNFRNIHQAVSISNP